MKLLVDINKKAGAIGIGTEAGEKEGVRIGANADMTGHKLGGLGEPEDDRDAATKAYVEARLKALADKLGVTI